MRSLHLCRSLLLFSTTQALPSINFPISSQVPPVARVSKPFQLVFSGSTFSGGQSLIEYSLESAPSWLQLDGKSRTLSGIPTARDLGPCTFHLIAADKTGSTPALVTLLVSEDTGPQLGTSVEQKISAHGIQSGPRSLVLRPSDSFLLSFGKDTFTNINNQTIFYANCADNTPLPSWVSFDARTLAFAGTTPDITSSLELPQDFGIQLIASDVAGFAGATAIFHLVVEEHILTFGNTSRTLQLDPGKAFNYTGLQSSLTLDGVPVDAKDLQQISADTPDWMLFDTKVLTLSGTAPLTAPKQSFSVLATDVHGNNANVTINIQLGASALITGVVGTLVTIAGSNFRYAFDRSRFQGTAVQIDVDVESAKSWLAFDSSSLTLSGKPPLDIIPQQYQLRLLVISGSRTEVQIFHLQVIPDNSTAPTTFESPSLPNASADPSQGPNKQAIVAAITVPLLVILVIIGCFCCRKRWAASPLKRTFRKEEMSLPIFQHSTLLNSTEILSTEAPNPEMKSTTQIPFRLSMRQMGRRSADAFASTFSTQFPGLVHRESLALGSDSRVQSADVTQATQPTQYHPVLQGDTIFEAQKSQQCPNDLSNHPSRLPSHLSSPLSSLAPRYSGLLARNGTSSQRISGIGHGSAQMERLPKKSSMPFRRSSGFGRYGFGHGRRPSSSLLPTSMRSWSESSWSTTSESRNSLSLFPPVPAHRPNRSRRTAGFPPRCTIRTVQISSSDSSTGNRPTRDYYFGANRANPFFAAGSSTRKSSHSMFSDLPISSFEIKDSQAIVTHVEKTSGQRKGEMMQGLHVSKIRKAQMPRFSSLSSRGSLSAVKRSSQTSQMSFGNRRGKAVDSTKPHSNSEDGGSSRSWQLATLNNLKDTTGNALHKVSSSRQYESYFEANGIKVGEQERASLESSAESGRDGRSNSRRAVFL